MNVKKLKAFVTVGFCTGFWLDNTCQSWLHVCPSNVQWCHRPNRMLQRNEEMEENMLLNECIN